VPARTPVVQASRHAAFRDLDVLEGPPVAVVLGLRKSYGRLTVELGAGTGFDQRSAYQHQASVALKYRFHLSR
jgi:hypothetical protein